METKVTKSRVSNEQLLAAIMAQTAAISSLVTVLTPAPTVPAKPAPVRMAHTAIVTEPSARLVGHLPEATEIPKGINVEWLAGLEAKARRWAAEKANGEAVFVYFVRNSFGQHKPLFARGSSKASANATSIYKRVN